ncbi:restriction endonuclease [Cohnella sp.]|uniref:restriction endonuclease n=1 Tax=Cohnella sp. TaxID=1883426 RepID=UPI0035672736
MARRSGFSGLVNSIAREYARQSRMTEADRKRREKDAIRADRDRERTKALMQKEAKAMEKEAKAAYIEGRVEEVEDLNTDISEYIRELSGVLAHTLKVNDKISFNTLRISEKFKEFQVPQELDNPHIRPRKDDYLKSVKAPGVVGKLVPGAENRYKKALEVVQLQYELDFAQYQKNENERLQKYNKLKSTYDEEKSRFEFKVKERNLEVDQFEQDYRNGEREAVIAYNNMVLERSDYPEGFPQTFRVAYISDSKELVIDYELPTKEIVPAVEEYKYTKSKDEISEKPRKPQEIKDIYLDIVAGITLRSIHEVLEADQGNVLEVVVFSGFVNTVDPATGKDVTPYLISTRVTKEKFLALDLSRIDKSVCLRNLGASVSARPAEMQAVKPVVEFDMVDRRFVDHEDMLDSLSNVPNLMDLNPYQFENLVTSLFSRMGLDAKQTRSSKDGGVDCVAFDTRPIVGGKVVIQAKRYKNTVGVSAVRDLYGTMMNEGANKGILVTTKGYGPDAHDFAKDKPIELIDGGGLLYLLDQNGIKARILFE